METILLIVRLVLAVALAMIAGKLIGKFKLPAILGFLLTGMVLGPFALNVMSEELTTSSWYHIMSQLFELSVGLLFAKELLIKKMKAYGKQVLTITVFESFGTFIIVTLMFSILFLFLNIPFYVAVIFGGIALATAPAPALSIINEYKTKGELTKTLIPVAIMDDVIAMAVFFSINAVIASMGASDVGSPLAMIVISIGLPVVLGIVLGFGATFIYKKTENKKLYAPMTLGIIIASYIISFCIDNFILPAPSINYMLLGMAMFTVVTNKVTEEKMEDISSSVSPIVYIGLVIMILNLSAPLDYHLILGAGTLTFVYIISRGIGKYFCTRLGAKISGASDNICKYLGLTFLPHSGVSLIFTGMAVTSLNTFDNESAALVNGTIAAAAVINEIFAVILAKKGFELAGEIDHTTHTTDNHSQIITINRQFGSGGREIGKRLADELQFAYYDKEIITAVAKESKINPNYIEKYGETSASRKYPYSFAHSFSEYSHSLENKIQIAQYIVLGELATKGNSVIIGRCANYILKKNKPFTVFIYSSDINHIINRCQEKALDNKTADEIKDEVLKINEVRSNYYNSVTDEIWDEKDNYHLCIDTSIIGIPEAIELIISAFNEYSTKN